jgi:hypothetical protein
MKSTRREALALAAALALPAAAQGRPLFFSADEFRMVDELAEMIVPADEHSPGARAAQVAAYLDRRLAESLETELRQLWREGLRRIVSLAREMHGRTFLASSPEQRLAVLSRIARHEAEPQELEDRFFAALKQAVARAYYTSRIGIHQEMEYQGNVALKEFVGVEVR